MEITIEEKTVYGNTLYYPICPKAKAFAYLSKTTTLSEDTLRTIKNNLGYSIVLQQKELSF